MSPATRWSPPPRLGEYRLVRPLGRGGMGHVWLAHDELLDRAVALKVIDAAEPRPDQRERFLREARAAARLSHPNVLAIYRVGELAGTPFLVAELVRGDSLDRVAKPLPWRRVAELGLGLARGLAAAHRAGVLHRDLKPSNAILTEDGNVKLVDFGLAKLLEPSAPVAAPSGPGPARGDDSTVTMRRARAGDAAHALDAAAAGADDDGDAAPAPLRTQTLLPPPEEAPADMAVRGGLTGKGAILGTPYYMSPEAWHGAPQTRQSDLYALGALLYELASGAPPFASVAVDALAQAVTTTDAPPLPVEPGEPADAMPGELRALIERCLARDVAGRPASADEVREVLERLLAPASASGLPRGEGNPYRGLAVFQPEHRGLLFGRDAAIDEVVDRLRGQGLVVVAGDSGVGKSSLVRAGVAPRIDEGALGGGRRWASVVAAPGADPMAALARALAPSLGLPADAVAASLAEPPRMAVRWLAGQLGHGRGLALVIDPLDDLIWHAEPERAASLARVLAELAAQAGPVRVVATARGDLLTRLAALPGLAAELPRALVVLPALDAAGLRAAIAEPARVAGVAFEPPDLVEELARAAEVAAGGLPLLSFALARLWAARDVGRGVIGRDAVAAVGGVDGALGQNADEVLAALPADQREVARHLLVALVDAAGAEVVRPRAALVDGPVAEAALDALVRGRLVRVHDEGYALAHARLATAWPALRDWLDASAERRAARERTVRAAAEWDRLGRPDTAAWSDVRLVEAALLPVAELGPRERAFLAASRRVVRRRRLARGAAVLSVPALAIGAWGAVRLQAARDVGLRARARLAEATATLVEARRQTGVLDVARAAAFARFDRGGEDAEAAWTAVRADAQAVDAAWTRAAQLAETSLLIDATDAARRTLADALYGRALAAEAAHRAGDAEELLQRLALYDAGGALAARWRAPATWTISTAPGPAAIELARFVEDAGGARWEPVAAPARTPAAITVAPGSYRARLVAPGRVAVVAPVLLARGEQLTTELALPAEASVPAGWIYVPPGRFLIGAAVEEQQRRDYFQAAPLHPTLTAAYLIQQHEATWDEWIAYLDALPPGERTASLPRAVAGGALGGVELRAVASSLAGASPAAGWELVIQPGSTELRAKLGAPLRYPGRTHGAAQDWRRMPVTGVSANQVRAYARFLAQRLGLPVRMCREPEWERAARGADGRAFPHGQHAAPTDVNHEATYGHRPDAIGPDEVGAHPASRSPFGLDDMAGNVFELVDGDGAQWARGGAYAFDILASRTELRDRFDASLGHVATGFRLCADPPR